MAGVQEAIDGLRWLESTPPSARAVRSRLNPNRVSAKGAAPVKPRATPVSISALERWSGRLAPHYPTKTLLSPVPVAVASWWRRVSLRDPGRSTEALVTLGDSLSATSHFLKCFAHSERRWGSDERVRASLRQLGGGWGEASALLRESHATISGATSWEMLRAKKGESPLRRELKENRGRFALVLLGTNDMNYFRGLKRYLTAMWSIGEELYKAGVIPIFSTLPPRLTSYEDQLKVNDFNLAIRAISAAMRAPLIDLYGALKPLKRKGLRRDLIHLNAYRGGCDLQRRGLRFGHNMRNYVSLKALSTVEAHLGAAALRGGGVGPLSQPPLSPSTLPPILTRGLPWVWLGDPQRAPRLVARPSAVCKELRDGEGRAVSASLEIKQMTWLTTLAFHPPQGDASAPEPLVALVELRDPKGQPQGCLRLNQPRDVHKLAPGQHRLWLLSPEGAERPYLFAIGRRR